MPTLRPLATHWPTALTLAAGTAAARAGDATAAGSPPLLLGGLLAALAAGLGVALWRQNRRLQEAVAARDDALSRLEHMAQHDPLTGLPNRAMVSDRLSQAIYRADRRGSRVAVCVVELDGRRRFNDELGRDAGDALLAALGQRLSIRLRATDTVGRLDDDAFALVLEEIDGTDAARGIAGDVQRLIAEPLETGGRSCVLAATLGLALYPDHGRDTPSLLRKAEAAMHAAKRAGGSGIRIHDDD
ncbi:GGDEF domain-containing protein [Azospira restricta]|uniref:GGDEF domain-containing protein n=1 Tax=Azospira restricta TaxID=404405 RepID=A0A974Y5C7_9RHOO|nr:GGDEF domain-containing protein [Azospira restricta]QRJ65268.1 GGDEF domain-containing protein [Azospira restricta]